MSAGAENQSEGKSSCRRFGAGDSCLLWTTTIARDDDDSVKYFGRNAANNNRALIGVLRCVLCCSRRHPNSQRYWLSSLSPAPQHRTGPPRLETFSVSELSFPLWRGLFRPEQLPFFV
ncbi:hypothetical protein LSTR_LSTR008443 [Laodelphax striatellus]|uniref:Uncharacterized protein n=1 Tax=Laodelphax striatellus TaxID=195883 RepID=A0A482XVB5_LAOST|nr:hypothetical protein LSTR_LSTR008443 [Laodelphax striatellus]